MKRCPKCGKQYSDDANFCPADAGHLEPVADGAPSEIPRVDTAGHALLAGRFALGEEIGGHRTGVVHEARDKQGTAPCVVKLVDPAVFPTPLLLQRSERELKQLERCTSPRVVRVLDHGKRDDTLWIASAHFEGTPLSALVESGGPLPEERVRALLAGVGEGLEEAAKLGVIHRDLAPKNILVGPDDQIGLINFGVPVPGDERVQGVPEFVAPEVAEGRPIDQRCNLYSLGAIAYFAVTGAPPFTGSREEVLQAHIDAEPAAPAGVSPGFAQLVQKALEKSSSKRFMTLRQLLGELEQVDAPGPAEPAAATEPMGAPAAQGKQGAAAIPDTAKTLMGMPAMGPEVAGGAPEEEGEAAEEPPAAASEPAAPEEAAVAGAAAPAPAGAAAPAPAAPVPAAPAVGGAAGGKKAGKAPAPESAPERQKKGKFRETMWFKKGELDEAAAQAAAAKRKEDELASDRADELGIDERYQDDGTLSSQDQQRLSLRTGATQMMEAVGQAEVASQVSERDLVSEMRAGRAKIIAAVVVGLGVLAAIIVYFAS